MPKRPRIGGWDVFDGTAIVALAAVYAWFSEDRIIGFIAGLLFCALGYMTVMWFGHLIPFLNRWLHKR